MNKPVSTSILSLPSVFTSDDVKVDDDDATTIAPIPLNFLFTKVTKILTHNTFSFHNNSGIYD